MNCTDWNHSLEYRYIIVYPVSCILRNTLCYPCNISNLLFLQLHIAAEHAVLELLQKRELIEVYLHVEEMILKLCGNSKSPRSSPVWAEAGAELSKNERYSLTLANLANLINVVCFGKALLPAGNNRPMAGKSSPRCSLERPVSKELMVIFIVRLSASKIRMLHDVCCW